MKKRFIYMATLVVVLLGIVILRVNLKNNGDTTSKREDLLNSVESGISIIAELPVKDYMICQIQKGKQIGCARFEKDKWGYKYRYHLLAWDDIVFDSFIAEQETYHVLICNKPNLERVEVVFSNTDTKAIIEKRSIELNGDMLCVIEAPDEKSYSINFTFFDTMGNEFKFR